MNRKAIGLFALVLITLSLVPVAAVAARPSPDFWYGVRATFYVKWKHPETRPYSARLEWDFEVNHTSPPQCGWRNVTIRANTTEYNLIWNGLVPLSFRQRTQELFYYFSYVHTITLTEINPSDGKTDPPKGTYYLEEGSTWSFRAIPDKDYRHLWYINGEDAGRSRVISGIVSEDLNISCKFIYDPTRTGSKLYAGGLRAGTLYKSDYNMLIIHLDRKPNSDIIEGSGHLYIVVDNYTKRTWISGGQDWVVLYMPPEMMNANSTISVTYAETPLEYKLCILD